ncbi:polyprenyl synthetase family protein [Rhodohalobacter mucosus]|uniref:Polyprenyl synthetase n=1 Tax=Rhodohalobacter mucosus TaxID=2079485 RepID=A0A316TUD1_9BACT|nr:polyprenyl synthetase family protein [Rhodohalobacter mucosus]PWN07428.1 polyprenyl synthetase [Rhodohalobacter mucosus]
MSTEAAIQNPATSTITSRSLREITKPVQDHLKTFRSFFKDEISSDVFLLDQIIRYLLRQKGKEIRPTLVFMTARMFGDINKRSYVAATMIELLHTATLIHDDVVDEADLRRDFLSINKLWKNKAGVLLGDFLLSKGLLVALDHKEYDLLHVLSDAVRKMSEGELRQLKTSKLFNMTEDRYYQIISEKTASLISACCRCGAIAATDNPDVVEKMGEIGLKVGIAFQIKDDLLDYGMDDVGKPRRNDIQERKITLPLIKALEHAGRSDSKHVVRLMKKRKKRSEDVDQIVKFVNDFGGLSGSREAMNRFASEALEELKKLPVKEGLEDFEELIQFIITRRK